MMCHIEKDSNEMLNGIKTENELFNLWEKEVDVFVRDGIFSENDLANKRVLFVLRDAHIVQEKALPPYDIRDIAKEPIGEGRTWNNVARWTLALLDRASYDQVEKITPYILSSQLKRVAAMNLKKKVGGSRAERIEEFAAKHRDFIKKQIEIINPDLVIACGTFANLKKYVFEDKTRTGCLIHGTPYKRYDITVNGKSVPIVEFYHPQYNKRNKDLVEDMLKIGDAIWGVD